MRKQTIDDRKEYMDIVSDAPLRVGIPLTKKVVSLRGIKPYTLEKLTELWIERDIASARVEKGSDVLKDMAKEPYFAVKEACIMVLNSYWKLKIVYPVMWRIWAYLKGYTEEQMLPIILEGKKKLQLSAHWNIMALSTDMRTDVMLMTKKEAEQYRAELLSAEKQHSSKTSRNTDRREGFSSDWFKSATGDTAAN